MTAPSSTNPTPSLGFAAGDPDPEVIMRDETTRPIPANSFHDPLPECTRVGVHPGAECGAFNRPAPRAGAEGDADMPRDTTTTGVAGVDVFRWFSPDDVNRVIRDGGCDRETAVLLARNLRAVRADLHECRQDYNAVVAEIEALRAAPAPREAAGEGLDVREIASRLAESFPHLVPHPADPAEVVLAVLTLVSGREDDIPASPSASADDDRLSAIAETVSRIAAERDAARAEVERLRTGYETPRARRSPLHEKGTPSRPSTPPQRPPLPPREVKP